MKKIIIKIRTSGPGDRRGCRRCETAAAAAAVLSRIYKLRSTVRGVLFLDACQLAAPDARRPAFPDGRVTRFLSGTDDETAR